MRDVYICDAIRTPFGRHGGTLATVRADDLGAVPIRAIMDRNPQVEWERLDDLIYGCANQAGEDNRNVARMSALLAGLPESVPGVTVNRLCGSGLDAVGSAARAIRCGEVEMMIAGGVESMSRAPFVMPKAEAAFSRANAVHDTTMGWRFVNPSMQEEYGTDSMPETAENLAEEYAIDRIDQDRFALWSQQKTAAAIHRGFFTGEIVPVLVPQRRGEPRWIDQDEHPRETSLASLSGLRPIVRENGSVTAGNSSGINDGACALLLASEAAVNEYDLTPRASVVAMSTAGVEPRIMGIGPAPASRQVLSMTGMNLDDVDVIELNEAFAAQALAVLRELGVAEDDPRVNPNGGAIAIGHPLGASGARLVTTAVNQLESLGSGLALCTMCVGVGQGIALIVKRT